MLRTAAIALGVCLVALAAMGMRAGVAADRPEVVEGEGLTVSPAPDATQSLVDPAEATVAFALREPTAAGPAWIAPQVAVEEVLEVDPGAPEDFFPYDEAGELATGADDSGLLQFPKREAWDNFSRRLDFALAAGSLERLVALEPEARAMLEALRAIPGHVEYADWLQQRVEEIEVARLAADGEQTIVPEEVPAIPLYDAWLHWMRDRPPPARASDLVPRLKPIFIAAQVPPALVWLAETESSFNPSARNRLGARGLYQIMPNTARELGMRLRPYDERLNPWLNAQYAARYLARLHALYGEWPLALAAYNAGPTRVSRLLKARGAKTYLEIADALPAETQLYVPKVLATLTVREGVSPVALALTQSALAQQ